MKKAVCIILALAVLMTCCAIGVSAKCTISDELRGQMDAAADDVTIRVNIWVNSVTMTEDELHQRAMTDAGFKIWEFDKLTSAQMNQYISARRNIESSLEQESCQRFIESFGLEEESINYTIATCINANLTKAQIEAAMNHSLVNAIYYDSQGELPNVAPTESGSSYRSKFEDYCDRQFFGAEVLRYKELYQHKDKNGETDWVLINGFTNGEYPAPLNAIIGNRVIMLGSCGIPFDSGYGVYDVKNDTFVDAQSAARGGYDGFVKVFDELGGGRLIGDLDGDDKLTIIDVTIFQRCEAKIRDYPADDEIKVDDGLWRYPVKYYTDFDRDGKRTILDATRLQRHLISE